MLSVSSFTGTIFAREVDATGTPLAGANFRDLGEVYPLQIQAKATEVKVKSRKVASAGQIIGSKSEIEDMSGSMTMRQWNAFNIARFFSGTETALTGTSGTWTATEATAPLPGQWLEFGHQDVSGVVITSDPAGTTYVAGTDYEVNAALGLWTTLAGGALAAGTVDVLTSGSYAAQSDYRIELGTRAQTRLQIKGELYNEFSGKTHTVELDCVQLTSSGPANLVSEAGSEGENLEFNMTLITVNGTSPGRIDGVPM